MLMSFFPLKQQIIFHNINQRERKTKDEEIFYICYLNTKFLCHPNLKCTATTVVLLFYIIAANFFYLKYGGETKNTLSVSTKTLLDNMKNIRPFYFKAHDINKEKI